MGGAASASSALLAHAHLHDASHRRRGDHDDVVHPFPVADHERLCSDPPVLRCRSPPPLHLLTQPANRPPSVLGQFLLHSHPSSCHLLIRLLLRHSIVFRHSCFSLFSACILICFFGLRNHLLSPYSLYPSLLAPCTTQMHVHDFHSARPRQRLGGRSEKRPNSRLHRRLSTTGIGPRRLSR